jgi:hypothetical protein
VSFKVLVVPEDHTNNGAILEPLVSALLADAGKPRAKVKVLDKPRVQGFDAAKKVIQNELVDIYPWMDLWIFMPDADKAGPAAMNALEAELQAKGIRLLCCPAEPEVEIYAAAAFSSEFAGPWAAARAHTKFKEVVFEPLLRRHGDPRRRAGGRDLMIEASLKNLPRLYQLCPELRLLRDRVAAIVDREP